jgi:hypothetical protein
LPPPRLLACWRELAGPTIAAKARPVCLEPDGTLVVAASSAAWRQELTLAAPQLAQGLRERGFGVQGLKLVSGRTTAAPSPSAPPGPTELSPEEEEQVQRMVAGAENRETARALAGVLRAQILAEKSRG